MSSANEKNFQQKEFSIRTLIYSLFREFGSRSEECQMKSAKFAAVSVIIHTGKCRLRHHLKTEQAAALLVY